MGIARAGFSDTRLKIHDCRSLASISNPRFKTVWWVADFPPLSPSAKLQHFGLSTARSDSASKWELRCATTPSELFASFVSSAIFDDAMKGNLGEEYSWEARGERHRTTMSVVTAQRGRPLGRAHEDAGEDYIICDRVSNNSARGHQHCDVSKGRT